jgi:hypothetical protein
MCLSLKTFAPLCIRRFEQLYLHNPAKLHICTCEYLSQRLLYYYLQKLMLPPYSIFGLNIKVRETFGENV